MALAVAAGAHADAPPTPASILKQLDAIQDRQKAAQKDSLAAILAEVNGAKEYADAALKLYQKAVFTVRYDGAKGDTGAYAKWTKDNEDLFRDPQFAKALSLHLQYLALTLQAARGDDPAKLADAATEFVRAYWDYAPSRPGSVEQQKAFSEKSGRPVKPVQEAPEIKELLDAGVAAAPLALFFQIDTLLPTVPNWSLVPSDYAGILTKEVFPPLRDAKNPALIGLWDEYIAHESEKADKNPLTDKRTHFQNEDLPTLRWKRAEDVVAVGQLNPGAAQMLEIIQAFPLHPDSPKWIDELRGLLQPSAEKK